MFLKWFSYDNFFFQKKCVPEFLKHLEIPGQGF